jgi:hypothetical protein
MSQIEKDIHEGFDCDPGNPEWAKAAAILLLCHRLENLSYIGDIAEKIELLSDKVSTVSESIDGLVAAVMEHKG